MAWTLTDDVAACQQAAGGLLQSDPVRNTVLLSVLASLISFGPTAFGSSPPMLGWWAADDGGHVAAAVLRTPPYALLMTSLPGRSALQLAAALAGRGVALPAINGAEADATAFAGEWQQKTGATGQVSQRQRLYRLGEPSPVGQAPDGAARVATIADAAVARAFYSAFAAETGQEDAPAHLVDDRLTAGQLMLWEAAGEPVSIAGCTAVLAGVTRIGPVYTPPHRRGRGFGGGVTAAIGELARERGAASLVLFADLANPASNSLYVRLGYMPVEDRVVLTFAR
jgi:predicted GNAT family acetyltransferase